MDDFQTETLRQGDALRHLATEYAGGEVRGALLEVPRPARVLLTGMGASYHAATWGSVLLCQRGVPAFAVEASVLVHFSRVLLEDADLVLFISQSGASAEVTPLLRALEGLERARDGSGAPRLVAVTNEPDSPLGRRARHVLPSFAGAERTVATKTYLNSMACLWLLAAHWTTDEEAAIEVVRRAAGAVDELLSDPVALVEPWHETLDASRDLFFLGHGPHVATARQAAMMMSEVLKRSAVGTGIGDFRHGLIEVADAATGVVLFGESGSTDGSVRALMSELRTYGSSVLSVVEGRPVHDGGDRAFDELIGPMLDVIPAQVFVASLAARLQIDTRFRHIGKVIERL